MGGVQKSLLRFGGETLIERQVREMKSVCGEIIVVTDEPRPFLPLLDRSVRIITDYYSGKKGPLVGIHAGLMLSTTQHVWVVGCDMPHISAKAASVLRDTLIKGGQAAVPNVGGGLFPLHGVYDRSCAGVAARLVEQGETSASALLRHILWEEVRESSFVDAGVSLRFISNMNTREDYEAETAELGKPADIRTYGAS
ncbi:molybdenum cofactor guanylyltransferase [Paenibacillus sp. TRM 82003]|nr:molybdenum cofactor guanylyltransferase [Paenibacillus sp. TRM 82003]